MAKLIEPPTFDFEGWSAVLGDQHERKIGHNTKLIRGLCNWETFLDTPEGKAVAVQYHLTYIVSFYDNGAIRLDSGGWRTATTKQRIHAVLGQRWTIYQHNHEWYVGGPNAQHFKFVDGMILVPSAPQPYEARWPSDLDPEPSHPEIITLKGFSLET